MPKERRKKVNYLLYGNSLIPNTVIDIKDFEFIDDIKQVPAEDYCRIFTVANSGMYSSYREGYLYYFLLKKDLFKKYLKELNK